MSYPTPYPPALGPQNECLFVVCCADSLKTGSSCKCCPCFGSTPQVFLQFSRILGSGKGKMVHRTEKVKNKDSSPQWRSFEVTLKQLCGGDKSKEFLIECFQEQQPNPKLLGSARTTVAQLQSMGAQSRGVQLQDSKGGHLESSIRFLGFQVRQNSQVPGQATSFTKSNQQAAPAYCPPANVVVPVPVTYPANISQPSGQPQMMCPPPLTSGPTRWRMKQSWMWSDMKIEDEWGNQVYRAEAELFAFGWNLTFYDVRTGQTIGQIKEKLKFLGMPEFSIILGGVEQAVVKKEMSFFKQKFTIRTNNGLIELTGDWLAHEYLFKRGANVVASVTKEWPALRDTYSVEIQSGENVVLILACCIVVDKCTTEN